MIWNNLSLVTNPFNWANSHTMCVIPHFYLTDMVETEGCGSWSHKNVSTCRICQSVNFSQRKAVAVALETSDRWLGTVAVVVFNECCGEIPTNAAGNESTLSNKIFHFVISITVLVYLPLEFEWIIPKAALFFCSLVGQKSHILCASWFSLLQDASVDPQTVRP